MSSIDPEMRLGMDSLWEVQRQIEGYVGYNGSAEERINSDRLIRDRIIRSIDEQKAKLISFKQSLSHEIGELIDRMEGIRSKFRLPKYRYSPFFDGDTTNPGRAGELHDIDREFLRDIEKIGQRVENILTYPDNDRISEIYKLASELTVMERRLERKHEVIGR
ncbi:MAG: hypothetical protein ACUVXI_14750 [bacterium]